MRLWAEERQEKKRKVLRTREPKHYRKQRRPSFICAKVKKGHHPKTIEKKTKWKKMQQFRIHLRKTVQQCVVHLFFLIHVNNTNFQSNARQKKNSDEEWSVDHRAAYFFCTPYQKAIIFGAFSFVAPKAQKRKKRRLLHWPNKKKRKMTKVKKPKKKEMRNFHFKNYIY